MENEKDFYDSTERCIMRLDSETADFFASIAIHLARRWGLGGVMEVHPLHKDTAFKVDEEAFCALADRVGTWTLFEGWMRYAAGMVENIKGEEIDWAEEGFASHFRPYHTSASRTISLRKLQSRIDNYPQGDGYVSIWVGDIRHDIDFDLYMDRFHEDFGFRVNDGEDNWSIISTLPTPSPIREKLHDLPGQAQWIDAAVEAAKKMKISEAATAYLIYDTRYDPGRYEMNRWAPLKFLGSFPCVLAEGDW